MGNQDQAVHDDELQAYADGRLDAARSAEVGSWLGSHPEEAARVAWYRDLRVQIRDRYEPVLAEPLPRSLTAVFETRRRWFPMARVAGLVALGLAVGAVSGWFLRASGGPVPPATVELSAPNAQPTLVRRAAIAHATYLPEVRHPVEVGADQEAHLSAWLSKRLGKPLRAPNLQVDGFELVGGRLLPGDYGAAGAPAPVAQFMYQCNEGRRVTLYVRPSGSQGRELSFHFAREGGVNVFYWGDRDLVYALSSVEVGKEELLRVANTTHRQLNP